MKKEGFFKEKKIIFIVLAIILFVASAADLFFMRRWAFINPTERISLESSSYASMDREGNTLVIANSSTQLIKLSQDGKVLWRDIAKTGDFVSPARAVTDGQGNVYVHDVQIKSGVRLDSETILKFDHNGNLIRTLRTFDAPKDCVRRSIVGLFPLDQGVLYAEKKDDRISLCNAETGESRDYLIDNAESMVLSAAYDKDTGDFYYSLYDGRIMKYKEAAEDILLYSSDMKEGSIPQYVSYADGKLYCNDIGLRDIIVIDTAASEVKRRAVEENIEDRYIDTDLSAENGLVSVSGLAVTYWYEDSYWQNESAPLSSVAMAKVAITWAGFIYMILFALTLIILILKRIFMGKDSYPKISTAVVFLIAVIAALYTFTLFPELKFQVTDEVYEREKLAANVVAASLPMDSFLNLTKPSDFMNEDYKKVKEAVHRVFFQESEDSSDLYCVLYRVIDETVTLTYTMEDICVAYPYDWEYEGSGIQAAMENGEIISEADSSSAGSFVYVYAPLEDKDGVIQGVIEVGTDLNSLEERNTRRLISLLINVLAIMVVSFMFVIELLYYIKGRQEYASQPEGTEKKIPVEIFRFVVFLIFFFTNLTCAILPIYAVRLSEAINLPWISPIMLSAIPISAEVVSGAVFSAVGGGIIKKLGTKKTVFFSAALFTVGLLIRAIPNIWVLILSAIILGAGWGVLLILVNILLAELPEEEKDRGYAYYSVSALSGINCAVVFGGFLIQWMSYFTLFILTGALSVYLFFVCRRYLVHEVSDDELEDESRGTLAETLSFLKNPSILIFFAFIMIPLLISGYFLTYLFPIVASDWGLSETHIGYSYILSGIVVLLTGAGLSDFLSARKLKHVGLAASAFVYAFAFFIVAMFRNIPALLISVVFLGIAESFSILLPAFFTDLKATEKYGFDKALGLYSLIENGAQSLGSFVFGYVLILGLKQGLMIVLSILTAFGVIFLIGYAIASKAEKEQEVKENG